MGRGVRRFAYCDCEGLEPRRLLSTAAANIALLSAGTTDSRGITLEYQVTGSAVSGPIAFTVERSQSAQGGAGDLDVATLTLDAGSTGVDSQGQAANTVGRHRVTLALPDGLPPTSAYPYVVVRVHAAPADNASTVDDTASFRVYSIAVITHGGLQPTKWLANGPPWVERLAARLQAQGYDAVVPVNWVGVSGIAGSAAKVARRVAPMIEDAAAQFPADSVVDLHMIGHSEGAVVNSEALLDLNAQGLPANLARGYIKVTMLDPHAATNDVTGPQYSVDSQLFGLGQIASSLIHDYQSRASDPLPVVPSNVQDAEVFFQHTPANQAQSNDGIYNLWGQVPVQGQAHYFNLTAPGVSHAGRFGVQDWYSVNVAPTLGSGAPAIQSLTLTGRLISSESSASSPRRSVATYTGQATPGSTVKLLAGRRGQNLVNLVGVTTADATGAWTIDSLPLARGTFRVIAAANVHNASVRTDRGRPFVVRPTAWLGTLSLNQ